MWYVNHKVLSHTDGASTHKKVWTAACELHSSPNARLRYAACKQAG